MIIKTLKRKSLTESGSAKREILTWFVAWMSEAMDKKLTILFFVAPEPCLANGLLSTYPKTCE